jgi:O-antigen ligase
VKSIALAVLLLAFAWTALSCAGAETGGWSIALLALVLLAVPLLARSQAPRLERWLAWPLALLPAWALFAIVPLPAAVVRLISPTRAVLSSPLPGSEYIPLSTFPALTLMEWTHWAGYILLFLIVRELAWRYSATRAPWVAVLPLVVVGCLEAALGLTQAFTGASGDMGAHGTYTNRDHFAALLEMALPFPVMFGLTALRRGRSREGSPLRPALIACGSFAAASLLLLGAVYSFSRMGFIASLFALGVAGAFAIPRKRWLLAVPAAGLLLLIYLPPDQLVARFADLSTADKIASQDRLEVWRQTLSLAAAYPITGCGLGTYESAFMPFKRSAPLATDNYAHNDYLQYLAELGIPGLALGLILVVGLMTMAARAASRQRSSSGRALAVACFASMSALLLHSLVDFNSYIPANAFAAAWVAAVAASTMFASGHLRAPGPARPPAVVSICMANLANPA